VEGYQWRGKFNNAATTNFLGNAGEKIDYKKWISGGCDSK